MRLSLLVLVCLAVPGPAAAEPCLQDARSFVIVTAPVEVVDDTAARFQDVSTELQSRLAMRDVNGYRMEGEQAIFINGRGAIMTACRAGSGAAVFLLAAVLAHEEAHGHGANEVEATEIELRTLRRFVAAKQLRLDVSLRQYIEVRRQIATSDKEE